MPTDATHIDLLLMPAANVSITLPNSKPCLLLTHPTTDNARNLLAIVDEVCADYPDTALFCAANARTEDFPCLSIDQSTNALWSLQADKTTNTWTLNTQTDSGETLFTQSFTTTTRETIADLAKHPTHNPNPSGNIHTAQPIHPEGMILTPEGFSPILVLNKLRSTP